MKKQNINVIKIKLFFENCIFYLKTLVNLFSISFFVGYSHLGATSFSVHHKETVRILYLAQPSYLDANWYSQQMKKYLPTINNNILYSNEDLKIWLPVTSKNKNFPDNRIEENTQISKKCRSLWQRVEDKTRKSHFFSWVSKTYKSPILAGYVSCELIGNCSLGPGSQEMVVQGRPCGTRFSKCNWSEIINEDYDEMRGECELEFNNELDNFGYYQKGHLISDKTVKSQWGEPEQTYSMCNVGFQTKLLNSPKWNRLEEAESRAFGYEESNSSNLQKKGVVLTGSIPPFHYDPFECVGNEKEIIPSGWFKIITDIDANKTYVFIFNNDCNAKNCEVQQSGQEGLDFLENATGFSFPETFIKEVASKGEYPDWYTKFVNDNDLCSENTCGSSTNNSAFEYGNCIKKLWNTQGCNKTGIESGRSCSDGICSAN